MTTSTTRRLMVGVLLGMAATAAATITPDERACQAGRGRAVYDMIAAEAACIRRCTGRAGADCRLDGDTAAARCVGRAKSHTQRTLLGAACRRDCPECYGGCGSDVASGEIDYSSGLVATFAADRVLRERSDAARSALHAAGGARGGLVRATARALLRAVSCRRVRRRRRGDVRTARCTERASRRAAAAIDAGCTHRGMPPACYGDRTAEAWIDLVRSAVDHGRAVIYCGSPSAAFVE
jgi:hypothetical protein